MSKFYALILKKRRPYTTYKCGDASDFVSLPRGSHRDSICAVGMPCRMDLLPLKEINKEISFQFTHSKSMDTICS